MYYAKISDEVGVCTMEITRGTTIYDYISRTAQRCFCVIRLVMIKHFGR